MQQLHRNPLSHCRYLPNLSYSSQVAQARIQGCNNSTPHCVALIENIPNFLFMCSKIYEEKSNSAFDTLSLFSKFCVPPTHAHAHVHTLFCLLFSPGAKRSASACWRGLSCTWIAQVHRETANRVSNRWKRKSAPTPCLIHYSRQANEVGTVGAINYK